MEPHVLSIVEKQLGAHVVELFEKLMAMQPTKTDVIVFLQGDQLDRTSKVVELYQKNFSPTVLITGNKERVQAEHDFYLAQITKYLVEAGIPGVALVVDEASLTTKDQAVNCIARAKKEGWNTMIVVTSPYHVLRAYLTFVKQIRDQQWKGSLIMQAAALDWKSIPSGRSITAIAMLSEELKKIDEYYKKGDLASIQEGLEYVT